VTHIDLVDQTFRDGQQCLWGMRLRTGMVTPVARELDTAGYSAIDITGSSMFECVLRYSREDPWEGLDHWRRAMPRTEFRSGVGSNRIVKFGLSPDAILDLWVQTLVKHGMGSFWVYDCLYNLDQMKRLCDTIHAAGAKALGAIFYGISPVHTDEWFAQRVRQMASWPSVSAIYVEDAPGILTPERARTLIPAVREALRGKPLELHSHTTIGLSPLTYLEGADLGIAALHVACGPLANGSSLPSAQSVVANLAEYLGAGEVDNVDEIEPGEGAIVRRGLAKHAVYRREDGSLVERSAVCTHVGCIVHWNSFEKCWDCPCHGSQFAPEGNVLNAPAIRPLAKTDEAVDVETKRPAFHEAD